ncbi:MAG: 2-oxo acid dehydrogenase subunit E2, partial [Rhodospirillales bacterium]|nr:2-oxo acid dehydrogenase subunit E2 [Rhodospirillales bacterium]
IAANMEKTLDVPVFRVSKTIATDAFDDLYRKLKPEGVTVSALLAKAVAVSLKKHPLINAAYGSTGTIEYNDHINVAQAVALEGGLITPTLKDADSTSLTDLSANWKDLVGKARSGSLKPEEYQTGTFTISNLGMFDVAQFDAILPPGQGAILAIASSKVVPIPMPGAALGVGLQKQMTVTITCDHRIISGADAAAFLKDFAAAVENPQSLV